AVTPSGARQQVRCARHRLGAAGDHRIDVADANRLDRVDDGLESRSADAIHRLAWHLDRHARAQTGLPRDVHARSSLKDAPHHDVTDIRRLHVRARDRFTNHDRPKIDRTQIFERAAERANRRSARAENDNFEILVHGSIIGVRSTPILESLMRVRVAIVAVVLSCVPLAAQSKRPMTVDDILDLVQVSAPRISPDGARVLYSKSELAKWKDNKRNSTIWIVDADGSNNHQFLSSDKDRSPAWSPDGKYVAFLSTRDQASGRDGDASGDGGGAQIWVIPVSGGEATKLTDHKGAIRSFEWSKDSASIFFVAEHADSDA